MTDRIAALETLVSEAPSLYEKLDAMTELAWELRHRDSSRSNSLTNDAFDLAETEPLNEMKRQKISANICRNRAFHAYYASDYEEAVRSAEMALDIYQSNDLIAAQMRPLGTLASALQHIGDYDLALTHSLRQLEIAETIDDQTIRADALNRIGVIYSHMGKYHEALEQYALCLPFYEAQNNLNGQARIYNNCLVEYQNLHENEKALEAGLKSLAVFEAAENLFGQSRIHGNLVRLYTQLNDYENAMRHSEQAMALADQLDNKEHKMINWLYVGQLYCAMGDNDQAITHIQTALDLARETKSLTWQYKCHQSLAAAYKNIADLQNALHHYEQFHTIKEAVYDEESTTKLRNLEVRFRTRAAQHEAEIYRQRNAELEALREQDRLYFERLTEMKDELLRTASHDLKSPLSTLSMLVFVLKGNPSLDDAGKSVIQQIDHQIERMRDFVIGVLDLAKLETGRALSIEPLPMVSFLKSIVQDFQHLADQNQITLAFESSDDNIAAQFDPVEIRRVVENLLTNAIKYTPTQGHVVLSIECTDQVYISVRDDGVGIPADALPHIFDRFYRVDNESHRTIDGSGLGLAIAKSIVEQHDGEIWVEESVEGEGTTFTFTLKPAQEAVTK